MSQTKLFCIWINPVLFTLTISLFFITSSHQAFANTLLVPSQYGTIQSALMTAGSGDEIVVSPGTYAGFQLQGSNVVIRSINPQNSLYRDTTIIDGNGTVAIQFKGTENDTCVLEGFTITNAAMYGAIWGNFTHATVRNCNIINNDGGGSGSAIYRFAGRIESNVISNNTAESYGAALRDCDGLIQFNTITNNKVTNTGSFGGALEGCDGTVQYNTISNNQSVMGGGAAYNCKAAFLFNTVSNNTVTISIGNGGAFLDCSGDIYNNVITNNSCRVNGGGINNCDGNIRVNIITYNIAGTNSTSAGGGIFGCDGIVENNIIAFNEASLRGGGAADCTANFTNNVVWGNKCSTKYQSKGGGLSNVSLVIDSCIIYNNSAKTLFELDDDCATPNYCCIKGGVVGGVGNIVEDPKLISPDTGDFHLASDSPCIDKGDPTDSDGCILPPGLGTGLCDIGAYGGVLNCDWMDIYQPHLTRFILGQQDLTSDQMSAADIDENGDINVADVILLLLGQ